MYIGRFPNAFPDVFFSKNVRGLDVAADTIGNKKKYAGRNLRFPVPVRWISTTCRGVRAFRGRTVVTRCDLYRRVARPRTRLTTYAPKAQRPVKTESAGGGGTYASVYAVRNLRAPDRFSRAGFFDFPYITAPGGHSRVFEQSFRRPPIKLFVKTVRSEIVDRSITLRRRNVRSFTQ